MQKETQQREIHGYRTGIDNKTIRVTRDGLFSDEEESKILERGILTGEKNRPQQKKV